jgi:hypothetical protein
MGYLSVKDTLRVGVDGISLAQDREKWRALVNAVMNLRIFHKMLGNYRLATQLMSSRVVLSSIEEWCLLGWYAVWQL